LDSYILGLSCGYHDSAAAVLRFSRVKQDAGFPVNALKYCLKEAGITLGDVETVFYYENPHKKLNRITATCMNFSWRGWHAAAAFFPSQFEQAAVLCVGGVGEWETTTAWTGLENTLTPVWDIRFPHSLGLLYSAVTYFCGFKVDSGEYKLMGLAPYGKPTDRQLLRNHLIDVKPDGSFWLNMEYFDYAVGDSMVSGKFCKLFGGPRREPEGLLTQREFDLAASVQLVLEETLLLLFPETLELKTRLEEYFGIVIEGLVPERTVDQQAEDIAPELWLSNPDLTALCEKLSRYKKTEPARRMDRRSASRAIGREGQHPGVGAL
jgi:carbamoyltransferase